MSPELFAQLTLAAFGVLAIVLIVWRAASCPAGWRMWALHVVARTYSCCCFQWRSNRRCPFLNAGPAIIIANHRSPLDPLFITSDPDNMRPLGFMMAREYYHVRGLRFINTNQECIPVLRDGNDLSATRAALRRLQAGKLLGVFPEGGINTGPGLRPANPGVAWLALRSRAPVYPIFIQNAPGGESMVKPFFSFTRVRVLYGDAIDLSEYYDREPREQVLEQVTNVLMAHLAKLGGIELSAAALPRS